MEEFQKYESKMEVEYYFYVYCRTVDAAESLGRERDPIDR